MGTDGIRGAQHLGIGRSLLGRAESIAVGGGYEEIAIISGIGVRGYYQKNGYELRGSYMMKSLVADSKKWWLMAQLLVALYILAQATRILM